MLNFVSYWAHSFNIFYGDSDIHWKEKYERGRINMRSTYVNGDYEEAPIEKSTMKC